MATTTHNAGDDDDDGSDTAGANKQQSENNNKNVLVIPTSDFLLKVQQHPYVIAGAGIALLVHLSALLSLPPAIMGRGAPFLPTSSKHGSAMFQQLQEHVTKSKSTTLQEKLRTKTLRFVDLGSGDGRLVFQAARQGIFQTSIGYEINPVLHGVAHTRRLLQAPHYWNSTQFYWKDIWKVNLTDVNVVAVYGLTPIMKPLGIKLQKELKPGSIVLSNVFAIPGWKPEATSLQGTHVYIVPPLPPTLEE
jgi:Histone methylation protein DOT1